MNNKTNAKRQAIKEQKEKEQDQILSRIIDNESKTLTFEATVSIQGEKKTGKFKAKYLGVAGRLRIGTIRAKLLEGAPAQSVDSVTDDIAFMISYLTVALVEFPQWWNYETLDDFGDLRAVYLEVYNFVNSFRTNHEKNTNVGNSSDSSGEETVEN